MQGPGRLTWKIWRISGALSLREGVSGLVMRSYTLRNRGRWVSPAMAMALPAPQILSDSAADLFRELAGSAAAALFPELTGSAAQLSA